MALRMIYSDYKSSFCELVEKDETFLIHHKNIQNLAIEIYKFLHNLSPCIMNNIFKVNQTVPYDLRKQNVPQSRNSSSVRYDIETINYIALKICSLAPETIKKCYSLKSFKQKIRKWKPNCPCRLCKGYVFATCWLRLIIRYLVLLLSFVIGKFINRCISCIVVDVYWIFIS